MDERDILYMIFSGEMYLRTLSFFYTPLLDGFSKKCFFPW